MNNNKYLPFLLLALSILTSPASVFAQCDDDQITPTAVCHAAISVAGSNDGSITLSAQDLDAGSTDNCTDQENLILRIALSDYEGDAPPETSSVELPEGTGTYFIRLWVIDEAANWGVCFSEITVLAPACSDDEEAPTTVCTNTEVYLSVPPFSTASVMAASLGANSTDNCDPGLSFSINLVGESASPDGENSYTFTEAGVYELAIWAIDDNGNFSSCISTVTVHEFSETNCENDVTPPVAVCNSNLTVDENHTLISAQSIDDGSYDECTSVFNLRYRIELFEGSTGEVPPSPSNAVQLPSDAGQYVVVLWVGDEADNWSSCFTEISVDSACTDDTTNPLAVCTAALQVAAHPIDGITIWPQDIDAASSDNCSDVTFELTVGGEPEDVIVNESSITFPPEIQEYTVVLTVSDLNGNSSVCFSTINVTGLSTVFDGQVFLDENENCTLDTDEEDTGFEGWKVRATNLNNGTTTDVFTNEEGYYQLHFISESLDNIQLEVLLPNGLSSACNTSVLITDADGSLITQNFAVEGINDCNYLTVDVATLYLRRCFDNTYAINYSNYSNFEIDNATIALTLDPYMTMVDAELPYTEIEGGRFLFELGTIPATSGGNFIVSVHLSCDAAVGATHCVEAQILPFDCITNDYAELKVEGECDETLGQVRFKVTNIGEQATTQSFNAIIVEDVIMNLQGESTDLDAGESIEFDFPANGATWRYEVDQDPSFPYGGLAASFVEGCGGFTPNIATLFSLRDPNPNISYSCQENVGLLNSNGMQAFPVGYTEEHIIEANTTIEYLIRFHNTNTETTTSVIIENQLSEWLDLSSLQPGASSYPYRVEQKENGLVLFHLDENQLPGIPVGENNFIKFSIDQVQDVPVGTRIENISNAYFNSDAAAAVTNMVFHTIGKNEITVATQEAFVKGVNVEIYPNPLQTEGLIVLNNYNCKNSVLQLFDATGRLVKEEAFDGNQVALNRKDFMSSGLYFFQITDQGQLLTQGKLIVD